MFADLDGSLFQTLPKCSGNALGTPVPAAEARDGSCNSFMTEGQELLFKALKAAGAVVPATARDLESFRRVKLPFTDGAILDFGGLILGPDGKADEEWLEGSASRARDAAPMLERALEISARASGKLRSDARARLVGDMGAVFYMVAKSPSRDLGALGLLKSELESELAGEARIWMNGNNLAVLPPFLDKGPAVARFMDRHLPWPRGETLALGLGDSASDLGFLELCDFRMFPSASQLGAGGPK